MFSAGTTVSWLRICHTFVNSLRKCNLPVSGIDGTADFMAMSTRFLPKVRDSFANWRKTTGSFVTYALLLSPLVFSSSPLPKCWNLFLNPFNAYFLLQTFEFIIRNCGHSTFYLECTWKIVIKKPKKINKNKLGKICCWEHSLGVSMEYQ